MYIKTVFPLGVCVVGVFCGVFFILKNSILMYRRVTSVCVCVCVCVAMFLFCVFVCVSWGGGGGGGVRWVIKVEFELHETHSMFRPQPDTHYVQTRNTRMFLFFFFKFIIIILKINIIILFY